MCLPFVIASWIRELLVVSIMVISVVSIILNQQPGVTPSCFGSDVRIHVSRKKVDGSNGGKEEYNLADGSAHQQKDEARIEEEVSDGEGVCSLNDSIDLKERECRR